MRKRDGWLVLALLGSATEPLTQAARAKTVRDNNQAVAALLDSAAKHVKSNQLDNAGAALEQAPVPDTPSQRSRRGIVRRLDRR
jgi:predicted negative regulator of RcsB-dependent stress response